MRIAQLTDLHLDPAEPHPHGVDTVANARAAVAALRKQAPDLVLVTGDLALHTGSRQAYALCRTVLDDVGCDYLVIPGNHDDASLFHALFGKRYRLQDGGLDRRVQVAGRDIVLLDSASGAIRAAQLDWLDAVLWSLHQDEKRGARLAGVLIAIHHPIAGGISRYMEANYALVGRESLLDLLAGYADRIAITVLSGHYHTDADVVVRGVRQLVTPSTYATIDPTQGTFRSVGNRPGYRLLDWSDDGGIATSVEYADG